MTETTSTPGPMTAPRPLYRDPGSAKLAGVCDAIGRYTDTDPVIWRIVTVVLTVFGGTGGILYLLGWLLIPKAAADGSIGDSWLTRHGHRVTPTGLAAVAIVGLVVLGRTDNGQGLGIAAVIALVGYLVYRERRGHPVTASYLASTASYGASTASPTYDGPPPHDAPASYGAPPGYGAPPTYAASVPLVRVPRERSRLGLATLSVAALVTGGLTWAALAGADGLSAPRITAVALLVVGAGLIVGTWYGRARWLVVIGLLLSLFLGAASAFDYAGGSLHGGIGQRTWVVRAGQPTQSFALGVGEARLDLSDLGSNGQHVVVRSTVSLGHLIILIPADVAIRVHAKARIGDITEFGRSLVSGSDTVERTRTYGPAGDPLVQVEATVGSGQIEVRHA